MWTRGLQGTWKEMFFHDIIGDALRIEKKKKKKKEMEMEIFFTGQSVILIYLLISL